MSPAVRTLFRSDIGDHCAAIRMPHPGRCRIQAPADARGAANFQIGARIIERAATCATATSPLPEHSVHKMATGIRERRKAL